MKERLIPHVHVLENLGGGMGVVYEGEGINLSQAVGEAQQLDTRLRAP